MRIRRRMHDRARHLRRARNTARNVSYVRTAQLLARARVTIAAGLTAFVRLRLSASARRS